MSRYERIKKLGALGEYEVKSLFESQGLKVTMSPNPFDSEKDMMVEDEQVEVKTLCLNYKFKGFVMDPKQWKKIDNADRVVFVKIPAESEKVTEIYELIDKEAYKLEPMGERKVVCRIYPLTELRKLSIIDNTEIIKNLKELSPSNYRLNN